MIFIAILVGCVVGIIAGMNAPIIPYSLSGYLAISIVAALDSVFGGITSVLKGKILSTSSVKTYVAITLPSFKT